MRSAGKDVTEKWCIDGRCPAKLPGQSLGNDATGGQQFIKKVLKQGDGQVLATSE